MDCQGFQISSRHFQSCLGYEESEHPTTGVAFVDDGLVRRSSNLEPSTGKCIEEMNLL